MQFSQVVKRNILVLAQHIKNLTNQTAREQNNFLTTTTTLLTFEQGRKKFTHKKKITRLKGVLASYNNEEVNKS